MEIKFTKAPFEDETNVNRWPTWTAKYCDIFKVIDLKNQFVNQIIRHAPIVGDRKQVLIDVRTQFLEPGFYTTTPGWHLDTPNDPRSLHHLYIVGQHRTEFMSSGEIKTIPVGHYCTYDGNALHRGVEVEVAEFRLFVRIQEVDEFESEGKFKTLSHFYPTKFPVDEPVYFIDEKEYYQSFADNQHLWSENA